VDTELEKRVLTFYKQGEYGEIIEYLNQYEKKNGVSPTTLYWRGISESKLQNYKDAAAHLSSAIKNGNNSDDIYYELGQNLYAINALEQARKAFYKSYKRNYNQLQSMYYVAYISQLMEEYVTAKKAYRSILVRKDADEKLRQVARFNIGEIIFEEIEGVNNPGDAVEKYVIPEYEKAYNLKPDSTVAQDIEQRMEEVRKKYKTEGYILKNGRSLPYKHWFINFSHEYKMDSNVTRISDNSASGTKEDSAINESKLQAKYRVVSGGKWIFEPKFNFNYTKHDEQTKPEVFQNDSMEYRLGLTLKNEHKSFKSPASLYANIEYNYNKEDYDKTHTLKYYDKYYKFTLGDSLKIFKAGDTIINLNYKKAYNHIDSYDSTNTGADITQVAVLKSSSVLIGYIGYEMARYAVNTSDTTTITAMGNYIMPQFFWGTTFKSSLLVTSSSYDNQPSRGAENTYALSLGLRKHLFLVTSIELGYTYETKTADNTEYEYDKQVYGLKLNLDF